ncbi:MAG: membrane lipoprotein lipid attachment site-containing protein [Endomicrobia bacterium]|nr:membrane lipoprotein lipid attachment site-containing protein [Endomicrobiia bacterium]MCL2506321.1 membrane lipoprotein lipid attachment site-containing protein [Endomicrobiia bacterium]
MKKILFLFVAALMLAGLSSCDNNILYPVNRVEIHDAAGNKLPAYKPGGFPVASFVQLNAVFLNSKNESLEVSNPEEILWTMSNGQDSWFLPTNAGYEVYFNPPAEAAGPDMLYMKVEYREFSAIVNFALN